MKLFKKLLSYIIALTMVLSLATLLGGNVYAAGETAEDAGNGTAAKPTYTLTINNTKANHKYAVYKVFGGDLKVDSETKTKTLSNVVWGNGVDAAKLLEDLKADSAFTKDNSNVFAKATKAADVAEVLSQNYAGFDSTGAKAFAKDVGQRLSTPVTFGEGENTKDYVESSDSDSSTTITLSEPGYYFVKDKDAVTGEDASTRFIVQVVGPARVDVKSSVPTVTKKVKDINDSEDSNIDDNAWQDSADHDIGDTVPYQITGTMPSNIADYTTYKYEFTDNMSEGLTYTDHTATITVDGKNVTSAFTETKTINDDKTTTVKWSIDDLKGINDPNDPHKKLSITPSTQVVVTYSAKLNGNAVIGSAGNPNTVYLKYSNNPNYTGEGKNSPEGQTPTDKNIVFTYKTVVNKVDQDGKTPLAGAGFTLNKWSKKENKFVATEKTAALNESGTSFTFSGLDDGIYQLVESKTPAGYNTMKPLEFEITATHTNDGVERPLTPLTLTNLTMKKMDPLEHADQTLGDDVTGSVSEGSMTTDVVNKKGSTLPSTGGMGTTLLYVAGGILVACAAAYVVLNKKRA